MGVKNFKRLLISIPKCIKLNSELILALGLGSHPEPRPNIYFFWGEMSDGNNKLLLFLIIYILSYFINNSFICLKLI